MPYRIFVALLTGLLVGGIPLSNGTSSHAADKKSESKKSDSGQSDSGQSSKKGQNGRKDAADDSALDPPRDLTAEELLAKYRKSKNFRNGDQIARIESDAIVESSGLAVSRHSDDVLWTHNDSGDKPRLFAFDRAGRHLGELNVNGVRRAIDWEDIAAFELDDKPWLLIADVGDNSSSREYSLLYLCVEPKEANGSVDVDQTVRFAYDNGPHDCEAVAFDTTSRSIMFISKSWQPWCEVYVLPLPDKSEEGIVTARQIARLPIPGVTAGDISPDGQRLILLSYGKGYEFVREKDENWAETLSRPGTIVELPVRKQGEAICYDRQGKSLYLTSERRPSPLFFIPGIDSETNKH
ncbi:MAG: hypothetical protein R3E01_28875 [Pirellulaceae bacterium]|nr:hypothetical protein [Planctomycetales bacterium]